MDGNILVAECFAEGASKGGGIVHREGEPSAVKTAAGPELELPGRGGIAVNTAALADAFPVISQESGSHGGLCGGIPGQAHRTESFLQDIHGAVQSELVVRKQGSQLFHSIGGGLSGLKILIAQKHEKKDIKQEKNQNGNIFQPIGFQEQNTSFLRGRSSLQPEGGEGIVAVVNVAQR